jgi:hypothetical protein
MYNGHLMRTDRYLRRELSLLTAHTPAELDADPMLAYRMDRLLQVQY